MTDKELEEHNAKMLGLDRSWTLEGFKKDIAQATTKEERFKILKKALDNIDVRQPDALEEIRKWKEDLIEIKKETESKYEN